MKKVLILTLAISLIVAGIALATVVSTKHDMRPGSSPTGAKATGATTSQVCVFCHHPHRGQNAVVSAALLWNISDASTIYQTYAATSTITSIGIQNPGDNVGAQDSTLTPSVYTLLCMGCHDGGGSTNSFIRGTVDGTLGSFPTLTGLPNLGSTLGDDHPVDFVYPASAGDVKPASGSDVIGNLTSVVYPLFSNGAASNQYTMQCATCHDVHNGQSLNVQFMRDKLAGGSTYAGGVIVNSRICVDCHTSK